MERVRVGMSAMVAAPGAADIDGVALQVAVEGDEYQRPDHRRLFLVSRS